MLGVRSGDAGEAEEILASAAAGRVDGRTEGGVWHRQVRKPEKWTSQHCGVQVA